MGTKRLYDYADDNPAVAMFPVSYVNNPYIAAKNDNLVAINSCVQIDFTGQICSESVGMNQISGVGGQVDFVLGTFPPEEEQLLPERLERAGEIIKEFCLSGIQNAMNHYNNK